MSVLKIKNGQGNWVTIPTIKGERGHSPEVTATKSNGVTTISVDGTSIATINDGEDATLDVSADEYSTSDTYAVGDYCAYDGGLYKCTTAIETAEAWNPNHWTQITITDEIQTLKQDLSNKVDDVQINGTSIVSNGVANVPVASGVNFGVVKISYGQGVNIDSVSKTLATYKADTATIKAGTNYYRPIVPYNQHESAFYALAKAAGDTTQSASSNAVGTYTDDAKKAIRKMLGIPNTEWELIADVTVAEDSDTVVADTDLSGQPFELSRLLARVWLQPSTTGAADYIRAANLATTDEGVNVSSSAPTKKYLANGVATFIEYTSELLGGINWSTGSVSSSPGSTGTIDKMSGEYTNIKCYRGFRISQYNSGTTPIPANTVIKLYLTKHIA